MGVCILLWRPLGGTWSGSVVTGMPSSCLPISLAPVAPLILALRHLCHVCRGFQGLWILLGTPLPSASTRSLNTATPSSCLPALMPPIEWPIVALWTLKYFDIGFQYMASTWCNQLGHNLMHSHYIDHLLKQVNFWPFLAPHAVLEPLNQNVPRLRPREDAIYDFQTPLCAPFCSGSSRNMYYSQNHRCP